MIDRIVGLTISTPRVDKLVSWIVAGWVMVVVARILGQVLGRV